MTEVQERGARHTGPTGCVRRAGGRRTEKTFDKLSEELSAIDPKTTQDRWTLIHNG